MFSRFIDNFDYSSRFRILKGGKISLVVSALLGSVIIASAAPTDGVVTSGTATISQNGNTTNINQTTSKASINWQNFNIASNETVNFNQPNKNSITLNRVIGNEKSVIDGALNANGQVWILNSNGILFSKDAKVNTSGLVATTAELSDKDFQDGNYNFKNSKSNSVVNLGTIEVANNGYVVLASNEVRNSGTIKAIKGKVFLSGNSEYTINLNGNSIVNLIVTKGILDSMVENSGTIVANGGEIYLTTNAVNELLKGVVNNTGIIEANSLDDVTGKVEVFAHGGTANVSGTIDASAPVSGDGGFIETSGKTVNISDSAKISTVSTNGAVGSWLIDPSDFYVAASGGNITGTALGTALNSGSVTIKTASNSTSCTGATCSAGSTGINGDIYVNDAVSFNANNTLTIDSYRNIYINNEITSNGASGKVTLLYGQGAVTSDNKASYDFGLGASGFAGKINLKSGSNFSSKLGNNGSIIPYTVVNTAVELQTAMNTLTGNYALGNNLNFTGVTWVKVGNIGSMYGGNFNGLGHTIDKLTMDGLSAPTRNTIGMFAYTKGAYISNIGLTHVTITGQYYVGALVASAWEGTKIINSYTTGSVTGSNPNAGSGQEYGLVGGLVGNTLGSGDIVGSHSDAVVSGNNMVGGLVGGGIADIVNSYATGAVTGTSSNVGGLTGIIATGGSVENSYATGNVIGGDNTGGLVGTKMMYGKVITSYATGNVIGASNVGGLIGRNVGGNNSISVENSYSTGDVNGSMDVGGLVGLNSSGIIKTSYTISKVTGSDNSGGFIGEDASSDYKSLSGFWNTQTSTQTKGIGNRTSSSTSPNVIGKTTVQMQTASTFISATTAWSITQNANLGAIYPILVSGAWVIGPTPISYTLTNITSGYTYSGISQFPTTTWSASRIFGSSYSSWVLGTDYNFVYNNNTAIGFTNAGTYSNISVNVLKSGYALTSTGNTLGNFTIVPKTLTFNATKIYDGTTAISNADLTVGGLVAGQTLTINGATANSANVTTANKYISAITIEDGSGGGMAANYTAPVLRNYSSSNKITIKAKALTVNGLTVASKTYNGTTSASVSSAGTIDKIGSDDVSFSTVATFNNANVEAIKTVDLDYTLSGTTAGNYTLVDVTGVATSAKINAKALTVTADTKTKTYGDATPTLTYALSESLIGSDTLSGNLSTTSQYSDVGTYNITSTLANTNYDITFIGNNQLTITKKDINILGLSGINKTYDGTTTAILNGTASLDTNSIVNGDTISISGTAVGNFVNANAENNKAIIVSGMTISGAKAGNYNVGMVTGLTANIDKKALTVSGLTVSSKTYDGTTTAILNGTASLDTNSIVNGDTISISGTAVGNFVNANAENNKAITVSGMTISGAKAGNYNVGTVTGLTANITKKDATVTANSDLTKVYNGETQNVSGFTVIGLVNNEATSVLGGVTGAIASGINAGVYNTHLVGTDRNYNLTFVDGSLVISKANATITANSDSKVYNGLTQSVSGFSASGLVNNETIDVLSGVTGASASGTNAGTYATQLSGTDENYNLTFVDGSLVITSLPTPTPTPTIKFDPITVVKTQVSVPVISVIPTINIPKVVVDAPKPMQLNQDMALKFGISQSSNVSLVSQPIVGQPNQVITLSDLKPQNSSSGTDSINVSEVRVPLSQNSIVDIVNGGVTLPVGVSQQFFIIDEQNNTNKGTN